MKRTGKFLTAYEGLLARLDCPCFSEPPPLVPRPAPISTSKEILEHMERLRQDKQMIDIHINVKEDVLTNVKEERFAAHKFVLAASSGYCKVFFAGNCGSQMLDRDEFDFNVGSRKASTLSIMLDSAYGRDFSAPELRNPNDNDEKANNLDHMLDLLICTDAWQMARLHSQVEDYLTEPGNAAIYRRADNVEDILAIAKLARASRVVKSCEAYIQHNQKGMSIMKSI